ncbi:putative hydro-lyase [Xanthobacter sp. AM11]|uniref:putative hydro-lyase n=1 Tax=Xanthobacter sp. AM11 TaxID=3380643 RepID=UPI0039BF4224
MSAPSFVPAGASPHAIRLACRSGAFAGLTSGLAAGYVQGNIVILPRDWADDFLRFCQRNPKPCPLIAVGDPGDPAFGELGLDLDIRTDLPAYRVYEHGKLVAEVSDIIAHWRKDFVAFVIGCSYSFEEALGAAGLGIRHVECGSIVPMYRTNLACRPAGRLSGQMVVSMRPFTPADAIRAIEITSRFAAVHGAPVHLGAPEAIGIADLSAPAFGDPVPLRPGEIPVFWACGYTPQTVIEQAAPPLAITHAPGRLLVTDLLNARLGAA